MVPPPAFTSAPVLKSQIFRQFTIPSIATSGTSLIVVAPFNDTVALGLFQNGALSSSSALIGMFDGTASTGVTNAYLTDQLTADLLTPKTTSGGTSVVSSRVTDLCFEIGVTSALAAVSGVFRFSRWTQGSIPIAGPLEYATVVETLLAMSPQVMTAADLLTPRCMHCSARSRDALEFVSAPVGPTSWSSYYGATTGLSTFSDNGPSWDPLVILFIGASRPEFTLTVRGSIEVLPLPFSFQWRMARPPAAVQNGAEEKWWQQQQRVAKTTLPTAVNGAPRRSAAGYVGNASSSPPQDTTSSRAPKRQNLRSSTAAPPRQRQSESVPKGVARSIADSAGRAAGQAILDMVRGQGPLGLPAMIQEPPRQELRRRAALAGGRRRRR